LWRRKALKKAIIVVRLVREAMDASNEKLAEEILRELSDDLPRVPWQEKVVQVAIVEN
jgi:hypothetical protein